MTKETDNVESAEAVVGHGPRFATIWFVPIVAVLIGAWMVYVHYVSLGPIIEIRFNSGTGIEAGNTKVKRNNVEIGQVLNVYLSEDSEHVVLSARINKENARLLREDTQFWVVRARIGRGGISGLSTLLSGSYIEMSPGTAEDTASEFDGLETPPVTPSGTPGLHITLDSDGNKALYAGDPILFHNIPVGTIELVYFNAERRRTYYNAFIKEPYDQLITTNTQFWFASGLNIELSADGIRVDVATLSAILSGGVSFDVPAGQPQGERITERAFFTIHPRESEIYEKHYKYALQYIILFDESIRGLRPGAPVEYRGVKVGRVLRTDIEYKNVENILDETSKIPVLIELVPARYGFDDTESALIEALVRIDDLITEGLHGTLATGSLITGQKLVELQFYEHTPHPEHTFAGIKVIPSVAGQFGRLIESVASTIDNINRLPLNEFFASARNALDQTGAALGNLDTILEDDASQEVMTTLNNALLQFQLLAEDFSAGSKTHEDMQQVLDSLQQTLSELEPVLKNLRRKPNSLIFGGPDDVDPEPQGAHQ